MNEPKEPLERQYTHLLQKHGHPDLPEVQAFVEEHKDNKSLMGRVKVLNRVFVIDCLKGTLVDDSKAGKKDGNEALLEDNPLIAYMDLLREHRNHEAEPVKDFIKSHKGNHSLLEKIKSINGFMLHGEEGIGLKK